MDSLALIGRLHQHRKWVNQQLLDVAERLSAEQLRRTFEIGQGSIWRSLTHLYAAEYIWLAALNGDASPSTRGDKAGQIPGNQQGPDGMRSLSVLRENWLLLEQRWDDYLSTLTAERLQDTCLPIWLLPRMALKGGK